MKKAIFLMLAWIGMSVAMAQNQVRKADIMYQKSIVRAIDLRERQNQSLFSKNREITSILIEAVLRGQITAYANDSLKTPLTIEQFRKKLVIPSTEAVLTPEEREIASIEGMLPEEPYFKEEYYFPKDIYQMELKENVLFDKERSRMYYDIQTLTIFIPADHPQNLRGIQDPVASFDFKELAEKVFKNNPNAIAYNPQNDAQHKNIADAFELRLFSSYIIKVSNANDEYLTDTFRDQHMGIMASQWAALEMLEYEHHLWEF